MEKELKEDTSEAKLTYVENRLPEPLSISVDLDSIYTSSSSSSCSLTSSTRSADPLTLLCHVSLIQSDSSMETDTAPMTTSERPLINGRGVPEIRTTVDSITGVFVPRTRCYYQQRKTCLAF